MIGPREIFRRELIKIGILENKASLIAVEAGSSQAIVNKHYLKNIEIPRKHINKSLELVIKFYTGELYSEDV